MRAEAERNSGPQAGPDIGDIENEERTAKARVAQMSQDERDTHEQVSITSEQSRTVEEPLWASKFDLGRVIGEGRSLPPRAA